MCGNKIETAGCVHRRPDKIAWVSLKCNYYPPHTTCSERERMGTAISNMLGAGEGNESEHSGVTKLSSSAQWQLHFKGMKDSNQLVRIDLILQPSYI